MAIKVTASERDTQTAVARYLRAKYPKVLFHSDFGSGLHMTKGQARINMLQNGGLRGWPDMEIVAQSVIDGHIKHRLYIELKKDGTRLKKKDGSWATPHIAEQAAVLQELERNDDIARFACGYDDAVELIEWYMKGRL